MSIEQIGSVARPSGQLDSVTVKQANADVQAQGAPLPGTRQASGEPIAEAAKTSAGDLKELSRAVDITNKFMLALSQNLQFSIDKDTSKVVVKLVDNSTKEVIRQMPSEEMLSLAKALDKLQGLLIRDKA